MGMWIRMFNLEQKFCWNKLNMIRYKHHKHISIFKNINSSKSVKIIALSFSNDQ